MNETAVLGTVVAALWGLVLALVGVVWSTLKERSAGLESKVDRLDKQNTEQETAIGRMTEKILAREEAHQQHREDMQSQFARIDMAMGQINTKLDRLLGGGTPYPRPGQYAHRPSTESGEKR
jgi:uncharacterized protein HemX